MNCNRETGMLARVLNDQCVESSQLLADAHRLCNDAIATAHEVLRYRDLLCDENACLKTQLQAVYIDVQCLNSLLDQVQTEKGLLESALHDERLKNKDLENKLTHERCSVDGLVNLYQNSSS